MGLESRAVLPGARLVSGSRSFGGGGGGGGGGERVPGLGDEVAGRTARPPGRRERVPGLRDDDVVDWLAALTEARQADLDDHRFVLAQDLERLRVWTENWDDGKWRLTEALRNTKCADTGVDAKLGARAELCGHGEVMSWGFDGLSNSVVL